MYDKLRDYLADLLREKTKWKVGFRESNDEAKKPYITYDLAEVYSDEINKQQYTLTVDAWDEDTPKNIINVIDKLDNEFKQYKDNTDDFVICIYRGTVKQFVDDPDKRVKRMMRTYDIILFSKGE